jgi:branched-chain amino acid transport system ATP-binding protein
MAILTVTNVSMRYGGLTALGEVSVGVGAGELVSIIGPNGAGKSTLFNVITGFARPSQGAVEFDGKSITGLAPHRIAKCGIGRSFQHSRLFPRLTVREHLRVACQGRFDARAEDEVLTLCGLEQKRKLFPTQISFEEQRKLEIARVLSARPRLILLDEPAAGLNSSETAHLSRLVLSIRGQGCSVILIDHNMGFVMDISERVVVLNFGRKIAEGTPPQIREDPKVRDAYLGTGA